MVSKTVTEYYNLNDLWRRFCVLYNRDDECEFAARYAAYHYFRSKGWIVRNGFKFGVDYLLYKEGPPFYHAKYSVMVQHEFEGQTRQHFNWNEISTLIRVSRNSRKELLLCTVTIPTASVENIGQSPQSIRLFTIDLLYLNRWNATKGDLEKVFHSTSATAVAALETHSAD